MFTIAAVLIPDAVHMDSSGFIHTLCSKQLSESKSPDLSRDLNCGGSIRPLPWLGSCPRFGVVNSIISDITNNVTFHELIIVFYSGLRQVYHCSRQESWVFVLGPFNRT